MSDGPAGPATPATASGGIAESARGPAVTGEVVGAAVLSANRAAGAPETADGDDDATGDGPEIPALEGLGVDGVVVDGAAEVDEVVADVAGEVVADVGDALDVAAGDDVDAGDPADDDGWLELDWPAAVESG